MIWEAIKKAVERQDLTQDEAAAAMTEIMDGEATPAQVASFITAMRMKGETVPEIVGFVKVMREKCNKVCAKSDGLIDTCGTGGDKLDTFNISTAAAFVVAGGGVKVAKHGNRAASSTCGSADVLEAIGVSISLAAPQVAECIDRVGIGFMFAPVMHPAMKNAVGPRREIGVRTVFNMLGPMTNPAGAKRQVIGVFSPDITETVASVLGELGSERAMVFHGMAGLDELSTLGETQVSELKGGKIRTYTVTPADAGLGIARAEDLAAGDSVEDKVQALLEVLNGQKGPRRNIVLLNAAAAFMVAGIAGDLREGVARAAESIDKGAAMNLLEKLKSVSLELEQS